MGGAGTEPPVAPFASYVTKFGEVFGTHCAYSVLLAFIVSVEPAG